MTKSVCVFYISREVVIKEDNELVPLALNIDQLFNYVFWAAKPVVPIHNGI